MGKLPIIGVTETFDPAYVPDWETKLKDVNIIITKSLTNSMIKKLIDNQSKCILHLTWTGFGGTKIEPNVPNSDTTYKQLEKLLENGFPPSQVVIRLDPIIPFMKNWKQYISVVLIVVSDLSKKYNTKFRCRYSIIDVYPHVRERFENIGVYIPYKTFHASKGYFNEVYDVLSIFKDEFIFESCAESDTPEFIENVGCVSLKDLHIFGYDDLTEEEYGVNGTRKGCLCLSKKNILGVKPSRCPNGCVYCYWKD